MVGGLVDAFLNKVVWRQFFQKTQLLKLYSSPSVPAVAKMAIIVCFAHLVSPIDWKRSFTAHSCQKANQCHYLTDNLFVIWFTYQKYFDSMLGVLFVYESQSPPLFLMKTSRFTLKRWKNERAELHCSYSRKSNNEVSNKTIMFNSIFAFFHAFCSTKL